MSAYGKAKGGAAYGYTQVLGYHRLLAVRDDTGEIVHTRMRSGSSQHGQSHFVDHQAPDFVVDRHRRYAELRDRCPVVFNQHYGGFRMVTDYESVAAVARDNETFAHKYEPDSSDGISYQGICGIPRPAYVPRMGVSEIDGPEHADLRRVLNPYMTPRAIQRRRPRMEAVSAWFLDQFVEDGAADLVLDYATAVPAVLTLEMMSIDAAN